MSAALGINYITLSEEELNLYRYRIRMLESNVDKTNEKYNVLAGSLDKMNFSFMELYQNLNVEFQRIHDRLDRLSTDILDKTVEMDQISRRVNNLENELGQQIENLEIKDLLGRVTRLEALLKAKENSLE